MILVYLKKFYNLSRSILILQLCLVALFILARDKELSISGRPPKVEANGLITLTTPPNCQITTDETISKCSSSLELKVDSGKSGYYWSTGSQSPSITVTQSGTYWWEYVDMSRNAVKNGSFSEGKQGFASGYDYRASQPNALFDEGTYAITNDPRSVHNQFATFSDHTNGAGLMMVVNGAVTAGVKVWSQDIVVEPFSTYVFSIWAASTVSMNPGFLKFSINGKSVGDISLSSSTGSWKEFKINWSSESNTAASIAIVNQRIDQGGNDFALDDIVFAPVCRKTYNVSLFANPPKPTIIANN
ncbi:hypothetical protein [Arcticibacter sp. MXS-1]|uniref:hypothetical protein n=1 Tax=Arcticibacter sp. MXS-1 TaxID=3341726 RepID=UPI0035A90BD8